MVLRCQAGRDKLELVVGRRHSRVHDASKTTAQILVTLSPVSSIRKGVGTVVAVDVGAWGKKYPMAHSPKMMQSMPFHRDVIIVSFRERSPQAPPWVVW